MGNSDGIGSIAIKKPKKKKTDRQLHKAPLKGAISLHKAPLKGVISFYKGPLRGYLIPQGSFKGATSLHKAPLSRLSSKEEKFNFRGTTVTSVDSEGDTAREIPHASLTTSKKTKVGRTWCDQMLVSSVSHKV